jgi:hypothetical protein
VRGGLQCVVSRSVDRLSAGLQEVTEWRFGIARYSTQELPAKLVGKIGAIAEPSEHGDNPQHRVGHRLDLPEARQIAGPPDAFRPLGYEPI